MTTRQLKVILLLSFLARLSGQDAESGTVRFFVVSEIGQRVTQATVRIEGSELRRTVDVRQGTAVELPFGVYTLACSHGRGLASGFKVVRVEKPYPIDVVFGLPLENPGQTFGEGDFSPFEISGQVTPEPKGVFGRVKVVGIFTEDLADSTVDNSGRFRMVLRNEGIYRLFVLYGDKIVHEQTLDLTFAMKRERELRIRFVVPRSSARVRREVQVKQ